ncbi:MAG: GNAT family N-acetyltransferase [Micrococcales bacterium]|nr:GNAT family N-acetyltransferase [Micrococcales bacterium]
MSFTDDAVAAIVPAQVVSVGPDRLEEVMDFDGLVWGEEHPASEAAYLRDLIEWDRSFGLETDRQLVGFCSAFSFDVPVPGGQRLDIGGLTAVGVHPAYRRRGFLKALLARHFQDCWDRGEPVSLLFASEPEIYGRFGYGVTSRAACLTIPRGTELRPVPGCDATSVVIETAEYDRHAAIVKEVCLAAGQGPLARPAWTLPTTEGEWRRWFYNPPETHRKVERRRIAVVWTDGRPTGVAIFRRDGKWGDWVPEATLEVILLVALDPASHHSLWSTLLHMDLVKTIKTDLMPLDEPLFAQVTDPRPIRAPVIDCLHARVLDLPAALEARRYGAPIDVAMAVTDRHFPSNAGLWRLVGGPDRATVTRLGEPPVDPTVADLTLDIREVGAIFFGGISAAALVAGGLIQARDSSPAHAVDLAFRSPLHPASPYGW